LGRLVLGAHAPAPAAAGGGGAADRVRAPVDVAVASAAARVPSLAAGPGGPLDAERAAAIRWQCLRLAGGRLDRLLRGDDALAHAGAVRPDAAQHLRPHPRAHAVP